MSKYGVFSGPYFPVFGLNTGIYGPEKIQYLDTFHAVHDMPGPMNNHCKKYVMCKFLCPEIKYKFSCEPGIKFLGGK